MLRLVTLVIFLLPLSCGRYSLRLVGRTPTSIQLQFPDTGGGLLMYVESELATASDPPWESLLVLEGNHEVTLTGLKPNTSYRLRWRTQSKVFSDVKVNTMEEFNYEVAATTTTATIIHTTTSTPSSLSLPEVITSDLNMKAMAM